MNFTREPIIETIISAKEGYKLLIRNTKSENTEEHLVDALEVVSFGQAFFFRSQERPKPFLVPVSDYEILEVKEARVALKHLTHEKNIKIGGGKVEAPEAAEAPSAPTSERKKDRRNRRRRRGGGGGGNAVPTEETAEESASEEVSEEKAKVVTAALISSLIPPPPTLISEKLGRQKKEEEAPKIMEEEVHFEPFFGNEPDPFL